MSHLYDTGEYIRQVSGHDQQSIRETIDKIGDLTAKTFPFETTGQVTIDLGDTQIITGLSDVDGAGGATLITFDKSFDTPPVVVISSFRVAEETEQNVYPMEISSITANTFQVQSRTILDTGVGTTDVDDNDDTDFFFTYIAIGRRIQ